MHALYVSYASLHKCTERKEMIIFLYYNERMKSKSNYIILLIFKYILNMKM